MKTFGLIGFPLGHSFSKRFFSEKFEKEAINAQYLNFELSVIEQLPEIIKAYPDLCGLNVTIPYKQQVIPFLDALAPEADRIGAVNIIRFIRSDGRLYLKGYNSDVIGFTQSLRPILKPYHRQALVLGTGGASKAIQVGLQSLGIHSTLVSRKADNPQVLTYSQLTPEILQAHTVIVNTTPLGMYPKVDTCPNLCYEALSDKHLLYDLVYNPLDTLFMQKGRQQGAIVRNGLEMLEGQALAAWEIWHRKEE